MLEKMELKKKNYDFFFCVGIDGFFFSFLNNHILLSIFVFTHDPLIAHGIKMFLLFLCAEINGMGKRTKKYF